ncbi:MAG: hypothetical protein N4J56_008010 [Chroococcidiopsis sp. SAG 2025]|uniref:S1 family peptidase n=1 Tax=Chroococcidiopsis sp. SAG 2025 TaxID=171389 RepID=UPI0029374833|nr:serine protease [Chroococcidiopsis sp. SAG 2025]MDV2998305.1 hypothetical protein [Chroococcidiopsis sp. SAG 2025]
MSAPPFALSNTLSPAQLSTTEKRALAVSELHKYARAITVKVRSTDSWGSGILIQRQGLVYTVVTNEHVLQPRKQHTVQTHDGIIYSASTVTAINFQNNDLAVLQFHSPNKVYSTALLAENETLVVGNEVFAAGFPADADTSQTTEFKFTDGNVTFVTDKALDGGYQVGYTNAVEKGMSGGPVLNLRGEVVAINGMHAHPLWGDPYVFKDGSKPCAPIYELMVKSSWAISIATFIQLFPKSSARQNSNSMRSLQISSQVKNSQQLPLEILQMRTKAEAAKKCMRLDT